MSCRRPIHFINPAGFTIHSAIHDAREDAKVVIHLHTDQGVAVSSQKEGPDAAQPDRNR